MLAGFSVVAMAATAALTAGGATSRALLTDTAPNVSTVVTAAQFLSVTTFAGSGTAAFANGTGTAASFNKPYGAVADGSGNLYVTDSAGYRIRLVTPAGVASTFAGSGTSGCTDGAAASASFMKPTSIARDGSGTFYVADAGCQSIRKVTSAGAVSTLAGSTSGVKGVTNGTGTAARFNDPYGVAVTSAGVVYVADTSSSAIRKVTAAGVVTTFAGSNGNAGYADGTGTAARFSKPYGIALDMTTSDLIVADRDNNLVRRVTQGGAVTSITGGGPDGYADGYQAKFAKPYGVTVMSSGLILVLDSGNQMVREVASDGFVTTMAGTGVLGSANGLARAATFNYPYSIAVISPTLMYVVDGENNLIRKIS